MRLEQINSFQESPSSFGSARPLSRDDFGQMLMDALREVNEAQIDARRIQQDLMAGRKVEPHDLVFALERASVAMQLTLQVRNKLLEAYQEIQRMQI